MRSYEAVRDEVGRHGEERDDDRHRSCLLSALHRDAAGVGVAMIVVYRGFATDNVVHADVVAEGSVSRRGPRVRCSSTCRMLNVL
jgi:hypothetical protein